jgi:hypothetical protein
VGKIAMFVCLQHVKVLGKRKVWRVVLVVVFGVEKRESGGNEMQNF